MWKKILVFFEIVVLLFSAINTPINASAATTDWGTTFLTNATLYSDTGTTPLTESYGNLNTKAVWDFTIPANSGIQAGQTMTVPIPSALKLSKDISFNIYDQNQNIIGTAIGSATNNNIVITLTPFAQSENTSDIKGTFNVFTLWNNVTQGQDVNVNFGFNNIIQVVHINTTGPDTRLFTKAGFLASGDPTTSNWTVTFNNGFLNLTNGYYVDNFGANQAFITSSFHLNYMNPDGTVAKTETWDTFSGQKTLTATGFTLTYPTLNQRVILYYNTTNTDGGISSQYFNYGSFTVDGQTPWTVNAATPFSGGSGSGYTLTKITVKKAWSDNNNQDGTRPTYAQIQILKDNQPDGPVQTLNAANNWTYTQINLDPASKYQAVEVNVPSGYSPSYSMSVDVNGAGVQTITNTHIPATTDLTGTKTWNDSNNQDGIRPASINVHLIANGNTANPVQSITTSADTGWNYTFSNVPVNANGTPITYTVTEDPVSGYTSTSTGLNLTNSYTPKTINVSGTKTWDDNNNQDGLRPSAITVNLIANGDTANPVASTTATAANNWAYTFSNVPENAAGTPITYTVTENNVPGYTATYNGTNITNTHIPATTSVSGTKTWDDNNNQDGMRPASITITLSANGKVVDSQEVTAANNWQYSFTNLAMNSGGNPIDYSVSESDVPNYTSAKDGYNFTNTHTPLTTSISGEKTWVDNDNQDGLRPSTITVNLIANGDTANPVATTQATAANNWAYNFTDLPQYANGKMITYSVEETPVTGYTATYNGMNITNTHTTDTTSVTGSKTWNDANNQDGMRPSSITVNLLANGKIVDSQPVTAANNWEYAFNNLPVNASGSPITYTVSEDEVANYTSTIKGTDITNTHNPLLTSISGTKLWADNNNQDGLRPSSISVNLIANGDTANPVATKIVTAADNWAYSFTDFPQFADGKLITYTVDETPVVGYTTTYNGTNITNTHVPATTSVVGTKTWNDANNQDGMRPESITVNLLANGKIVASQVVTSTTNWEYAFNDLPVNASGSPITYTVSEDEVANYTSTVDGTNITNTHTPEVTTITGSKTWNDENNKDGVRPDSIIVNLLADGKVVVSKTVTAKDNWKYSFEKMPVNKDGKAIVYSITEDEVKGYKTEVKGFNLTNTHQVVPSKTETSKPTPPSKGNTINSQNLPKTGSDNDLSAMIFGALLLLVATFGGIKGYRKR